MTRTAHRLVGGVLGVVALVGATGCTPADTGASDHTVQVPLAQVDTTTDALCAVQTQAGPRGQVRATVAGLQATEALTSRFRAAHGLQDQPAEVQAFNTQLTQLRAEGVEEPEAVARALTARSRLVSTLAHVAVKDLAAQGQVVDLADPQQADAAVQLGAQAFATWLTDQEVAFDPRLGLDGSSIRLSQEQGINPLSYGPRDIGSVPIGAPAVAAGTPSDLPPLTTAQICGS